MTVEGWESALNATNVTVAGTITHLEQPVGVLEDQHRILVRATHLEVLSTGHIDADGKGHPEEQGEGHGTSRSGGGYGGTGGRGVFTGVPGKTYGCPWAPDRLGSGGTTARDNDTGGSGGGAIKLEVADKLLVEGTISANGGDAVLRGGGGSGGSIWLVAGTVSGSGTIRSDGGETGSVQHSGGGGGGRIAFDTENNVFSGILSAKGQPASGNPGRSGTFNFMSDPNLDLVITNDIALPPGSNWVFRSLSVDHGAVFEIQSERGTAEEQYTDEIASRIRILGDVIVATGSAISADGQGSLDNEGEGAGPSRTGGSYGGLGAIGSSGNDPGDIYGLPEAPDRLGSGGGESSGAGGYGGGAVLLTVDGNITVDGAISARGDPSNNRGGGGSGGSIRLRTNRISGSGELIATGGNGNNTDHGGGGGGGRIALEVLISDQLTGEAPGTYIDYPGSPNGTVDVNGGMGYSTGMPGTFYLWIRQGTLIFMR